MATPAEVIRIRNFGTPAVDARARAIESFRETRRRRRTRGAIDTAADSIMASGGLMVANAALHLNIGLPQGRNGLALGGVLLATGLAWITRAFRTGNDPEDPAAIARRPVYVVYDAEARSAA